MEENIDIFAFYIITENDDFGETAHGPYTMKEAEQILKVEEKIITGKRLASMLPSTLPSQSQKEISTQANNDILKKMSQEINKWRFFLILLGIIQLATSGFLSNTWGILLIIVGLSSFYYNSASMFVVYGTTLGWASISNAFSGSGGWLAFSLLQIYFAFQTFRQYFLYKNAYRELIEHTESSKLIDKAEKSFPWVSFGTGLLSFAGMIIVFLSIVILVGTGNEDLFSIVDFTEGLVIDIALIGFATGLAAVLSSYEHKLFSIIGMVAGALVLIFEIVVAIL